MSEKVEGQVTEPSEMTKPEVKVEELMSRMEQLEKSNSRLLDESKTWKSKYQSIRSEAEEREHETLKQSNDFKGLYEKTLDQVGTLKGQLTEVQKERLETSLKYEVAKNGGDADDMDILLAAVKTKKKDVLGYDSESQNWKGVDLAVEDLRKSNPGLFKSNVPGMENGRPISAVVKEKTVDEMIQEDPDTVLLDALKQIL